MPKGVKTASSPAADQDEKNTDEVDGQVDGSQSESSTDNDAQPESSTGRDDQPGNADDAKTPTPLDELRGELTKAQPEAKAEDEEEEGDEPTEPKTEDRDDDQGESEDAEGDEPEGDESEGDEPEDDDEDSEKSKDFLKTLPKESRDAVGRHIASTLKARVEEKIERHPAIKAGKFLETMRTKHGLDEDEVVASLVLSAAFKAGDPRAVKAMDDHADYLREQLKMPARVVEAPAVVPFVGALPPEFADMVTMLGFEEKDVRFLCAALKQHKEPAPAKPAPQAPVERQERQIRQVQQQPELTPGGFHVEDTAAADDAVREFLLSKGVKAVELKKVWGELTPILEQRAPVNPATGKPDVRFIDPERRLKAVQIAHQRLVIAQAKQLAERKRAAGPGAAGTSAPVRTGSQSSAKAADPLSALRRKLVTPR